MENIENFVHEWIEAFNSHQLEQILSHYDDKIEFLSPFIKLLNFNNEGIIKDKKSLEHYFSIGLKAYPNLHFKLHHYFVGVNSVVIYYTSVNEKLATEMFILNEEHKAIKVFCHYQS